MPQNIYDNLDKLIREGKLNREIVLWGISTQTENLISQIQSRGLTVSRIVDNFKYTFYTEYCGIKVTEPCVMRDRDEECVVLLAVNYSEAIRKQLDAYKIREIYNLRNLEECSTGVRCTIPYHFENRSKGRTVLCYVMAGYEEYLWDVVLKRVKLFSDAKIDYCIVSSGVYSGRLSRIAGEYGWSYLYTERNQVCYIQNLVVELHEKADYIFKMDEDMFISKGFFSMMLDAYHEIEEKGEYRIGFLAPMIPLNCTGYVSYLDAIGRKKEFEERFGRAYRSRFSSVYSREDAALYLWGTMKSFDRQAELLSWRKKYVACNCYFNIGLILYSRERWLMMGKWPVEENETGMGQDERYILNDNAEKDFAIYEIQNVLAGHLAFGNQKIAMRRFFDENKHIFGVE